MQNPVSQNTPQASPITPLASRASPLNPRRAFTLLELLTVIAIMGIVAAISLPTLRGLKPNAKVAATRDLLGAVGRARQLAISHRTTVYMVFLPLQFWVAPVSATWTPNDWAAATNLVDKQLTGYAYVCLRGVGDQPGAPHPRYLDGSWKTLPKGAFIHPAKFSTGLTVTNTTLGPGAFFIPPFSVTNNIPFPSETNRPALAARPYIPLPYIAFDGMGQLISGQPGQPELIPLTEGSVSIARDPNTKVAVALSAQANEVPPGNTTNNYSLVYIDRLTGRARVERRSVQ